MNLIFRFCLITLLLVLSLNERAMAATTGMGSEDARHLLNRAGFGARPADVAAFAKLSRAEAVERLLSEIPSEAQTPAPAILTDFVPQKQIRDMPDDDGKAFQRERAGTIRAWWVSEMLAAETPAVQLREHMTLFWHNHFVSSLPKVKSAKLMLDQNRLLRRLALGSFSTLLHEVSKDPAMIVYLDSATSKKASPNENFAREVMELFTLGEGHYSEQDVKEAARAFTGWSIDPETGGFLFRPRIHDTGSKTVLGVSGNFDGDAVLDILLARPQTAEFVVKKLWREFVSLNPDDKEVRRLAEIYRQSAYDTRRVLKEMLLSESFWGAKNRAGLIKSPVDWVIGSLNTLAIPPADRPSSLILARAVGMLGQDLFAPPNVKGWPGGETWINSSSLLARKQMIERLTRREGLAEQGRALLEPAAQLK